MTKDTEKSTAVTVLPVPLSKTAQTNLLKIQGQRQAKEGKKTTLKTLANEIIENAKA